MKSHAFSNAVSYVAFVCSSSALGNVASAQVDAGATAQHVGPSAAEAVAEPVAATYPITVSGSVTIASEYRYRGVSYTGDDPAAQVFLTVAHESGLYVGFFGSNLAGFASLGGSHLEADIFVGYTTTKGKFTLDGGIWSYSFQGAANADFVEIYAAVAVPVRLGKVKIGAYYAPSQQATGSKDGLSAYVDASLPIGGSPITLKAHAGYTTGKGSTLAGPSGDYWDFLVGAEVAWRRYTLNLSYVDTTIYRQAADIYYPVGGRRVINGAAVFTLTAAF